MSNLPDIKVLQYDNLDPDELKIYMFIKDCIEKFYIAPDNKEIGRACRISEQNVPKYLRKLQKRGLITVKYGKHSGVGLVKRKLE